MDFLDFDTDELYFDEQLNEEAQACLLHASEAYGETSAEDALLRAEEIQPEHPMVMVALYRYFYYQHRLDRALEVAERVLSVFSRRLQLPANWHKLQIRDVEAVDKSARTTLRFYLLALKGAGYLELRLGAHESALARLQKVADVDAKDRLGAQALLDVARYSLNTPHIIS
jgi:tetratricopeptide (TPR) repeat protein